MKLQLPLTDNQKLDFKPCDYLELSGTIYVARDAAHKRLSELLEKGEELPIPLKNQAIYYMGPTPLNPVNNSVSAGPTTSTRMDRYTPVLLEAGLKVMIGKGKRIAEVVDSIRKNGAMYLVTVGGAGAYLGKCIKKIEVVAFPELGPEAIYKLEVEDFPAYVELV